MKKDLLLPHRFKRIGWLILVPAFVLGMIFILNGWEYPLPIEGSLGPCEDTISRILNNISLIGITIGGVMVSCSREKVEDEMIGRLRLNALLAAFYVNYALLIVACLAVYDMNFLNVMLFNLFTMLLIFLAVFRWKLWRLKKEVRDEE